MAGKGRPEVEDKRVKQYRVLMNEEEEAMLDYCCRVTGLRKSQIFRKGLEAIFQQIQLDEADAEYNDRISMERVMKCPYCEFGNTIDLKKYIEMKETNGFQQERDNKYYISCENYECRQCGKQFSVYGSMHEYPVGVFDSEDLKVEPSDKEDTSEYLDQDTKSHWEGASKKRDYISHEEFEDICRQVASSHPIIVDYFFEKPGGFHVKFSSNSGKTITYVIFYFGRNGRIWPDGWEYLDNRHADVYKYIGEEISGKIRSALYQ